MNLQEIMQTDQTYYMNTFGPRFPVCFERGEGMTLYDTEGRPYLDFFAGIAVNVLGYHHPAFTKAVCAQVEKLIHCSSLYYIEAQAGLAKKLVNNTCADRAFFCNSGAEANEGAIKLARKYFYNKGEERYEVLTALNSFHGRTLATLAATGQEKYQKPYHPLTPAFVNLPYGDLSALEKAVSPKTCAVLLECVQGEGGVIPASKAYLQGVARLCKEKGILLILDEIQTGIGRTGTLFAHQGYEIEPDIFTCAKALGNGIPIAAILAKQEVASAFTPGDHGTTFGGNPLACTAGLAVLSELLDNGLLEKSQPVAAYLAQQLEALKAAKPSIAEVRGKGFLWGIELVESLPAKEVCARALEKGLVIGTAAHNTLRLAPPLILTNADVDTCIATLSALL